MLQQKASKAGLAPYISKVYITPKQGIIVMEKMEKSLKDHIIDYNLWTPGTRKQKERASEEVANVFAVMMGDLIIRLHQLGIYHTDDHLDNVMTKDNKLCFIDFGMAKRVDEKLQSISLDYKYDQLSNMSGNFMTHYNRYLREIMDLEKEAISQNRHSQLHILTPKVKEEFDRIIKQTNAYMS
jgi:tRNA A-37 threonylcarbamoyl transferase component Bud32